MLLLPNYPEEIPAQARQARELGIEATLFGDDAWPAVPFAAVPELEGAYFTQNWHPAQAEDNTAARRFLLSYRQATGLEPTDHAALTYDAFGLLLHAVAIAGDDPEEIRRALAETPGYRGVTGTIDYRAAGGDPVNG